MIIKKFVKENCEILNLLLIVFFIFSIPLWNYKSDSRIYRELNKHASEIVIDTNGMADYGRFYGTLYDKDSTVICNIRFHVYTKNVTVKYDEGKYLYYDIFNNDKKLYNTVANLHGFEELHTISKKDFYKKLK